MADINVISDQQIVTDDGEIRYRTTIERSPQELINVWDPRRQDKQFKYVKMRNSLEAKNKIMSLTRDERAFLFPLLQYMDWESNILVGDSKTAGIKDQPLKWKDVEKITGFEQRTRRNIVQGLIDKKVVSFLGDDFKKGIMINPQYALNGKKPSQALINTFLVKEPITDFYKV